MKLRSGRRVRGTGALGREASFRRPRCGREDLTFTRRRLRKQSQDFDIAMTTVSKATPIFIRSERNAVNVNRGFLTMTEQRP